MALNRAHTSANENDTAKLLLLIKHFEKHVSARSASTICVDYGTYGAH